MMDIPETEFARTHRAAENETILLWADEQQLEMEMFV
jgi:hypothetical protein